MRSFSHNKRVGLTLGATTFALGALAGATALAQDRQAMIDSALTAAPSAITDTAKIMTMGGEVLRDGAGPYTCFPREGAGSAPMCLDGEWMRWADAWLNKKDFKGERIGLAYMLAGDSADGGASNVDPFAAAATPDNQWVVEGPHVMIIVPDPAQLDGISTDPNAGVPYVMWKATPYAHIMMPTGPRPQ